MEATTKFGLAAVVGCSALNEYRYHKDTFPLTSTLGTLAASGLGAGLAAIFGRHAWCGAGVGAIGITVWGIGDAWLARREALKREAARALCNQQNRHWSVQTGTCS